MADHPATKAARYMVEISAPQAGWQDVDRLIRRARASANHSSNDVRFMRAIFVPEDSSYLLLYEAGSAQEATSAAAAVDFDVTRVSEVEKVEHGGAP